MTGNLIQCCIHNLVFFRLYIYIKKKTNITFYKARRNFNNIFHHNIKKPYNLMITLFFFSSSDDFIKYILSHWIHTEILNRVKDELYMLLSRHNIKVVILYFMKEMNILTSFRFDPLFKMKIMFFLEFMKGC